jgi:hypothetical protein
VRPREEILDVWRQNASDVDGTSVGSCDYSLVTEGTCTEFLHASILLMTR